MIKVGILGFGFMGRMHFMHYQERDDVTVAAICEADEKRLRNPEGEGGNVEGADGPVDLTGVGLYTDFDQMLDECELDVLSITLPTFLHAEFSRRALEHGVHVLCEKPMALNLEQCDVMIDAANASGKILQIGHCIRFWPEYAKAKELVDSGEYGKLLSASLRRLSARPGWSQDNWLQNSERSGGMELDLHIHDSDYVQYLLGMPKSVYSCGARDPQGGLGHVTTQYLYDGNMTVLAEGGWLLQPSFGFEMSFNMALENATICYDNTREPALRICPAEGDPFTPEVAAGDGYTLEIAHFIRASRGDEVAPVLTLESSRDSIRLVEAERASVESGMPVSLG